MRMSSLVLVSLLETCTALLEEAIVSFNHSSGAVPIHDAKIVHASDAAVGVTIAIASLAGDWEAITGRRPDTSGLPSNSTRGDGNTTSAIIVATYGSGLAIELAENGCLGRNSTILEGKREAFTTSIGEKCLPGVDLALVITGSDMRGTIFGIYTLAEQAGQSP